MQACKNLCESLVRKSYNSSWERLGGPPDQVGAADVVRVVESDEAFDVFSNKGLGVKPDPAATSSKTSTKT